jgi:hypothetical protein
MNSALVALLLGLLDRAAALKALIDTTRAEGRDPTVAEIDALFAADESARATLQAQIDAARAAGG